MNDPDTAEAKLAEMIQTVQSLQTELEQLRQKMTQLSTKLYLDRLTRGQLYPPPRGEPDWGPEDFSGD